MCVPAVVSLQTLRGNCSVAVACKQLYKQMCDGDCSVADAIAFGDKTTPANQPGANSLLTGAVSDNNAFIGTRYFALGNDFPNNQYYLFFFQWTVRRLPTSHSSTTWPR
jgi:hypothetical protein